MKYDFDEPVNRRDTDSMKWNVAAHELPMWVADMDFHTAPEIQEALAKRAAHGVFGYTELSDAWYRAYIDWWNLRHDFLMEKEWLVFCTGIVPAISSIVRKLTTPAEAVLIQTPVYNIFFNSILNNGCRVLQSPLTYDGVGYEIAFDELEQKLSDPQTTLMILCNPHNPIGTVWNRETLYKIGELCHKHHVTVVSDEIHCDITDPACKYTPFAAVSDHCREISITCIAPTKAFNLAGLQTAAVVIPNDHLRHKVWRAFNTDEIAEPNAFAVEAAVAAFTKGGTWLEQLTVYIQKNKEVAGEYIRHELPEIKVTPSQATYLLWLDCGGLSGDSSKLARVIREQTGLVLSEGGQFGGNGGHFLRMNVACARVVLKDGLRRLKEGVEAYRTATKTVC